jgi:hypothetical protein
MIACARMCVHAVRAYIHTYILCVESLYVCDACGRTCLHVRPHVYISTFYVYKVRTYACVLAYVFA